MNRLLTGLLAVFVAAPVAAQQAAPAPDITDPAKALGLMVYPAKGQAPELQKTDTQACYEWGAQQSGVSLTTKGPDVDSAAKASQAKTAGATQGAAVGGAARGAVAGVAIGAIAGDAGTGAAIGAVAGGLAGRRAKKSAEAQSAKAGASQAQQQSAAQKDALKKAMSVCLEGRGYTVR
jgi:uncharacterized protein YcfJ